VFAVKDGVVKEPVVPADPPSGAVHESLLVDVQLMVAFVPLAIEGGVAETETLGEGVTEITVVVEPALPPPHEARRVTANNAAIKDLSRTIG
jgi:hypothetical protein